MDPKYINTNSTERFLSVILAQNGFYVFFFAFYFSDWSSLRQTFIKVRSFDCCCCCCCCLKRVHNIKVMISKRCRYRVSTSKLFFPVQFLLFLFFFLSHQTLITHRSCKPQGMKYFVRDINMIWNIRWNREKKTQKQHKKIPFFLSIHYCDWCKRMCIRVVDVFYFW